MTKLRIGEWVIMGPSQHAEGPSIPIGQAVKVREVIE